MKLVSDELNGELESIYNNPQLLIDSIDKIATDIFSNRKDREYLSKSITFDTTIEINGKIISLCQIKDLANSTIISLYLTKRISELNNLRKFLIDNDLSIETYALKNALRQVVKK